MTRLPTALKPWWPYAKAAHVRLTGLVAPASMALSRRRGGQVPHAVVVAAEGAVRPEHGGGVVHAARPGEAVARAVPVGTPPGHPQLLAKRRASIPATVVAELPGGRYVGPSGAIVTSTGTFVHELSPYFGIRRPAQHPVFLEASLPPPTHLDGRVAVLAGRADSTYYHFLAESLPRVDLVERFGGRAPDRWLAPLASGFQRQLLERIGIDPATVVDSSALRHVRADELVVPSLPDPHLEGPRWTVELLRARLLPQAPPARTGRRLYLTRGRRPSTRILVNEDELLARLEPLGFEVFDPGAVPVADQIEAFAGAEAVVGVHGAAFTNLVFLPAGARVVEVFAPDYVQHCYWALAEHVEGVTYRYVVGRRARGRGPTRMNAGTASDVEVDVGAVLAQLAAR